MMEGSRCAGTAKEECMANNKGNLAQNFKEIVDSIGKGTFSGVIQVLAAILGAAAGGGISFAALYFLGSDGLSATGITSGLARAGKLVGGGMVPGIFVMALPIVVLSGAGVGLISYMQNKKLKAQRAQLVDAVLAQGRNIQNTKDEAEADRKRADELQSLNKQLRSELDMLRAQTPEVMAEGIQEAPQGAAEGSAEQIAEEIAQAPEAAAESVQEAAGAAAGGIEEAAEAAESMQEAAEGSAAETVEEIAQAPEAMAESIQEALPGETEGSAAEIVEEIAQAAEAAESIQEAAGAAEEIAGEAAEEFTGEAGGISQGYHDLQDKTEADQTEKKQWEDGMEDEAGAEPKAENEEPESEASPGQPKPASDEDIDAELEALKAAIQAKNSLQSGQ